MNTTVRDPVNGDAITFVGNRAEANAMALVELSARHWLSIIEVYRMVRVALFGLKALDDSYDPFADRDWAECDAARLRNNPRGLSIEELLDIHDRALRGIERSLEQETDPIRRMKLEALLQPTKTWLEIEDIAEAAKRRAAQ